MKDISDAFTSSTVKGHLESYEFVENVMVSRKPENDSHVFEVYVSEQSNSIEGQVRADLEVYGPTISAEESTTGEEYYRIEISGLIDNT